MCYDLFVALFFFADHQGHVDLYQRTRRRTTKFLWFLSSANRESQVRAVTRTLTLAVQLSPKSTKLSLTRHCHIYRRKLSKLASTTVDRNSGGHLKLCKCTCMFSHDWIRDCNPWLTIISPAIKDLNLGGIPFLTLFG